MEKNETSNVHRISYDFFQKMQWSFWRKIRLLTKRESTRHREASSSFRAAQILRQSPLHPIFRANPCPGVTDLFCRLPLPTLFCGPEAANLGDLMRLWVRSGVQKNLLRLFKGSWKRIGHLEWGALPADETYRQAIWFQGKWLLKREDNASRSSHLHCRIPFRYRTLSTSWLENINPTPFQGTKQSLRVRNTPVFWDRLTHVQLLFTWNPSPPRSSKVSFECLLLSPKICT